jgi:hypothetical protein
MYVLVRVVMAAGHKQTHTEGLRENWLYVLDRGHVYAT